MMDLVSIFNTIDFVGTNNGLGESSAEPSQCEGFQWGEKTHIGGSKLEYSDGFFRVQYGFPGVGH